MNSTDHLNIRNANVKLFSVLQVKGVKSKRKGFENSNCYEPNASPNWLSSHQLNLPTEINYLLKMFNFVGNQMSSTASSVWVISLFGKMIVFRFLAFLNNTWWFKTCQRIQYRKRTPSFIPYHFIFLLFWKVACKANSSKCVGTYGELKLTHFLSSTYFRFYWFITYFTYIKNKRDRIPSWIDHSSWEHVSYVTNETVDSCKFRMVYA